MNKKNKIIPIIIYLIIIVVLVTIMIISTNKNFKISSSLSKLDINKLRPEDIVKTEQIDISKIKEIIINTTNSEILIETTTDEQLKVVQYARKIKDTEEFKITQKDTNLEIQDMIGRGINFSPINISTRNSIIKVYLPEKYINNLKIENISGDTHIISNLELNELILSNTSGEINIRKNIYVQVFNVKTVSGDIDILKINSELSTLSTTSGEIDIEEITTSKLVGKTVSGDIKISKITGHLNLKTTSGSINLSNFLIKKESEIKTVSGDVKINKTGESDILVLAKSLSGTIETFDGNNSKGKEPYNKLNIKTTSGDIKVG